VLVCEEAVARRRFPVIGHRGVAMTVEDSEDLKEAARGLIYWGQVPVHVTIGGTGFTIALFPGDGRYLVPVKVAVRRAEAIGEGAIVEVVLRLNAARRE
jgi:hypothetical protein